MSTQETKAKLSGVLTLNPMMDKSPAAKVVCAFKGLADEKHNSTTKKELLTMRKRLVRFSIISVEIVGCVIKF